MGSFGDLSCAKQTGYGAGFILYNVGGSVLVGVLRGGTSVCYLSRHAYRKWCLNIELPSDTTDNIRRATGVIGGGLSPRYHFTDYKSADGQVKFWLLELFRAITEIFIPIVASLLWSIRDLTIHTGAGTEQYDEVTKLAVNICGVNEVSKACEWERETWASIKAQSS